MVYVGFMELEKLYDRVNKQALWQVLRMYIVGGKLLNKEGNVDIQKNRKGVIPAYFMPLKCRALGVHEEIKAKMRYLRNI